jgi:ribosomal protein L12E/L44/L45/RPP1/RPP2
VGLIIQGDTLGPCGRDSLKRAFSPDILFLPMKTPRKLLILVLLLLAVVAVAWLLRRRSLELPDSTRMLPEGEVIIYTNLRPVHLWEAGKSRPIQIEGEYQNFIDQTGIQFERDLDEVAMSRRDTPDGRDTESAEIFTGRFDEQKLKDYLAKISSLRETYREHTIFIIPHEGHTVRVCLLGNGRVGITNMQSGDPIRGMVDAAFKLPDGPALARLYYEHVPLGSLAWVITRVPANSNGPQLPNGWSFDFLQNTVTVASVRYTGDVQVRADVLAASEKEAKRVVDGATSFLSLYEAVATSVDPRGTDPDVKAALKSVEVHQEKSVAVFSATLSQRFLKKLVSEAQTEAATAAPAPTPTPKAGRKTR